MKWMIPFAGKRSIAEMEVWIQQQVDMEVPGCIRIGSEWTGQFRFGLVSGDVGGRIEQCGSISRFEFSRSGREDNDPACCRGWAIIFRAGIQRANRGAMGDPTLSASN